MTRKQINRLRAQFVKAPKGRVGVQGHPREVVEAIFADYMEGGESLIYTARLWNRSSGLIADLLKNRGLRQPDPTRQQRIRDRQRVEGTGIFARMKRATPAEISALIAKATKFSIPDKLRWEFRHWPISKRGEFIARLRAKLKPPSTRPETPFSANVEPFDYASPSARKIMDKLNEGLGSREATCKLNLISQGVIYRGELYFWTQKAGYCKRGAWTPENGRPQLHRVIWEETHGRKVPPQHVVRFIDGNDNNLAPENLTLQSRNNLARENQATGLFRKSREVTALLFKRAQEMETNGHITTLKSLKAA
jgi:hypothetical protein